MSNDHAAFLSGRKLLFLSGEIEKKQKYHAPDQLIVQLYIYFAVSA